MADGANFKAKEQNTYENSLSVLGEFPLRSGESLFLGVNRYDSSTLGKHWTWKALLRKELSKGEVFRFGYGTSVRGPDLIALYFSDINLMQPNPSPPPLAMSRTLLGGNEDLEVEEFDFAELGYEKRWEQSSLQARAYYGTAKNMLSLRTTGEPPIDLSPVGGPILPVLEFFNDDNESTLFGFTSTWDHKFNEKWSTLLSWRYLHAEKDDGSKIRYSPRNHINLTMTYKGDERSSLNLTSRTYSSYGTGENAFSAGGKVDGYTVFDFAAKKSLGPENKQSLWLKVLNLSDRRVIEAYPSTTFPPTESPAWFTERRIVAGYSFRF